MKKFLNWLFNFCPEIGELIMGALALRYAWLISHPEPSIADSSTVSILQRVLKVAAPLYYWSFVLLFLGLWQVTSLLSDFSIGRKSIKSRKSASFFGMITWGLVSFSYIKNSQPLILSLTFFMFFFFCFFILLVLRRQERRHINGEE